MTDAARPGFRHVVLFRWKPEATTEQRRAAIEALQRFAKDIAHLGHLTVGEDAGLAEQNADVAVVVDFARREDYLEYAKHPLHLELIEKYLRPILAERTAVQHELS